MEKCKLYPVCKPEEGPDGCLLYNSLRHQADHGGKNEPGMRPNEGSAGPYWKRSAWGSFVGRTKKTSLKGCPYREEVKKEAERITEEKKEAGEFY